MACAICSGMPAAVSKKLSATQVDGSPSSVPWFLPRVLGAGCGATTHEPAQPIEPGRGIGVRQRGHVALVVAAGHGGCIDPAHSVAGVLFDVVTRLGLR